MDTDPADSRPDVLDENWGHWVFVFDHGRFAITQENPRACTWGYGTFAVRGDQTTWQFTDGGGKAPNGAVNKPGESFSYRFSAYRDTLTLSPVKGRISPVNFIAKPWRKISSSASPGRLSRHCPPPVA
jgi:hypothetical protein